MLGGWAYAASYRNSAERTAAPDEGSGTTTINENTQPQPQAPDRSPQRANQPTQYLRLGRPVEVGDRDGHELVLSK